MLTLFNKSILYCREYNNIKNNKINKKPFCYKKKLKINKIKDSPMEKPVKEGKITYLYGKHMNKRKVERKEFKKLKKKMTLTSDVKEQKNYIKEDSGLEKNHLHLLIEHENNFYKTTKTSVNKVEKFIYNKGEFVLNELEVVEGFVPLHQIPKDLVDIYKDKNKYENLDIEITDNIPVNKIKKIYNYKNGEDIRNHLIDKGTYIETEIDDFDHD